MDKLGHMRTLVTVAKLGSFSAAAKELGVTPGMVSKQVKQLEDGLDVRLLHRTTRGVSLTDAGEFYLERVVDILHRIEDTESSLAALAGGPRGMLRIHSPPAFGTNVLTAVIAGFAREYPDVRVELSLEDEQPDVVVSRLDLVFRLGHLRDSSLVSRQVGAVPFVLCAAPAYLERHGVPVAPGSLDVFNCIVDGSIQVDRVWEFRVGTRRVAQPVDGSFYSPSTEAVIEAATEGLGIAYVPQYAVIEELEGGELVAIEMPGVSSLELPLYALYGSRDHVAAKIRDFLAYFVSHVDAASGVHCSGGTRPARSREVADVAADVAG